jgi:serine protease Do
MKPRTLIGALVAAGVIGTGVGAAWHDQLTAPFSQARAAPAARRRGGARGQSHATSLPLTGFTELVKTYGPAVVNISVQGTQKTGMQMPDIPGSRDSPFRDFFAFRGRAARQRADARPRLRLHREPDGYILTNAHVVANADEVTVRLTDRREFKAKVDRRRQAERHRGPQDRREEPAHGEDRRLEEREAGEWVAAIGSPFGFENSVSAGIVSAKARSLPTRTTSRSSRPTSR